MARYAMVCEDCGHVVNVIEWQAEGSGVAAPAGHTMVEDTEGTAGPGSLYDNDTNTFEPAPGMVPEAAEEKGE